MNFPRAQVGKFTLVTSLLVMSCSLEADVIFEENFDSQPDFTSTMHAHTYSSRNVDQGDVLPEGWLTAWYDTLWSPETGYPDNHATVEILASNTDKARGGVGKSMVNWRESYDAGWLKWNSDSQTQTRFDQEYNELYMEFWISFSPNWAGRVLEDGGTSKIARIGHYDGVGNALNGAAGSIGPVFIWDYVQGQYGLRNNAAFRGGPPGYNYNMVPSNHGFENQGNFGSSTVGMAPGGTNPQVVDQVNGGYLADIGRYTWIWHDQLWGPAGHWTKVAFYVKMNSAPGVADGLMMQWINDERVKFVDTVPWVGENPENKMVGWNFISLGGNDFFRPYPNDQRFEDWYAIDDVVVRTSIPGELLAGESSAPNPPDGIEIQ